MQHVVKVIDKINRAIGNSIPLLIIPLIGIIIFEVTMRRYLNMPTIWVHELSVYIFGASWILVGGFALLNNKMVNMDVLSMRFSSKTKALIDICTFVFTFIFTFVLFWKSLELAIDSIIWKEMSETIWRVPFYPIRMLLPLGAFLALIQLISKLIKDIYTLKGEEYK